MKSSNIGGQAVLEGVMMKNGDQYAVAVRKPDGEIALQKEVYDGIVKWKKLTKIPFVRGIFSFVDSLVLGMKTLSYSASFFEEEEEEELTEKEAAKKEKRENLIMGITMACSVVIAVAIFMVLPYLLSNLLKPFVPGRFARTVIEGIVRIVLFIAYILLISKMKDIQRVFMYHGAEHKCINCIEHGMDLTVENVSKKFQTAQAVWDKFSDFLYCLSVLSSAFFITTESPVLRVLLRIALLPVIAGISYEIIRLAGNTEHPVVELLSKPGASASESDDERAG